MARAGWFIVALLSIAGCFGPSQNPLPSSSSSPSSPSAWLSVKPATAILFEPVPQSGSFDFDVKGRYDYGPAGPRTEDSYECSAFVTAGGWMTVVDARPSGSVYLAEREGEMQNYAGLAIGHAQSPFIEGLAGHDPGLWMLVGHDRVGPTVTSNITIQANHGMLQERNESRFWCLDGVTRFTEGNYLASDQRVEAQGLGWNNSFDAGILLRFQTSASIAGLAITGPDGAHPASTTDGSSDYTFCSPRPGNWRLSVDSLRANAQWSLVVRVFDVRLPNFTCSGEWLPTNVLKGVAQYAESTPSAAHLS